MVDPGLILQGLRIEFRVGFLRVSFELPQETPRAIPPAIDFGTPEVDLGSTLYGLGADVRRGVLRFSV